jgi:hypothetical protein
MRFPNGVFDPSERTRKDIVRVHPAFSVSQKRIASKAIALPPAYKPDGVDNANCGENYIKGELDPPWNVLLKQFEYWNEC